MPSAAKGIAPVPRPRHYLKVSSYTTAPGGRFHADGQSPGSEFLETWLDPAFAKAQAANAVLVVDLDSAPAGYPSSFLDQAFAGLARKYGIQEVLNGIELKSDREPYLIKDILEEYIPEAND